MQPLISDEELKRVFKCYLCNSQSMDVYGLKCAIFHLYGDKLSKADLGELIGDHLFLGLSLDAFIACCRVHEGTNRFDGNRKIMQQCFLAIDTKEKRYINQHDVTQLLKKVTPHLGAAHVFEMIDTLQLGKVTFTQFCAHYTAATGVKII
jgi:hypothetical protein